MLKVLNEHYYLDIDAMENYINIPPSTDVVSGDTHISVVKYEMVKTMVEILMTESEEVDETLGQKSSSLSIPFKLAFNTLINKKIINKY
jgi:hypothetical protein